MGGWNNRPWRGRRYRDCDRDRGPSRPPLPPPDHGLEHCSVPLWEREFCSYVGNISWQKFRENKRYACMHTNIENWDDSGAFESFQNAKARFWANYHGQPSDIPFPDPDMYIDKVDHRCKVDSELVAELDKIRPRFDSDTNSGLGNAEADNKCNNQNKSGNWDKYIEEKPAQVNAWEDDSRPKERWGGKLECDFNKWGYSTFGWDDELETADWRGSSENRHHSNSRNNFDGGSNNWYQDSNNRNNFHGGSNNWHQDPNNMSGRKRNGGGHFQHRNNKQRSQAEGHQRSGWQDDRRRNTEWRPIHSRNSQNNVQEGTQGGP